jgi:hypothetical protein
LIYQQIEVHYIEAVNYLTYVGTELTRENEEEIEIHNRIMSENKALLYNCDLYAENINSEYIGIYISIKLNSHECGSLSPWHGASSGCGWRNGLLYGV